MGRLALPAAAAAAVQPLFSPDGDLLAVGSGSDGSVRLYDAGTGQLKATLGAASEDGANLAERNTCAAWATAGGKKKKKKASSSWSLRLLVGTAHGDVKAFDPHSGQLLWRAHACIQGGVQALAHSSRRPGMALAAGASGQLVGLSVETGEVLETHDASKHAISCLALSPDGLHALGGSSTLSLWHLPGEQQCERVGRFTGHAGAASAAVFAPSSRAAVSGSPDERHVAIWLIPPPAAAAAQDADVATPGGSASAKKKRGAKGLRPAAATLAMQQPPVQLDVCADPQQQQQGQEEHGLANGNGAPAAAEEEGAQGGGLPAFCVGALSAAGDAYVWRCRGGEAAADEEEGGAEAEAAQGVLLARVHVAPQDAGQGGGLSDRVLAVKLLLLPQDGTSGLALRVARGSAARPVFETVPVPLGKPGKKQRAADVALPPLAGGALLPGNAATAAAGADGERPSKPRKSEPTVLGPGGGGGGTAGASGKAQRLEDGPAGMDVSGEEGAEEEAAEEEGEEPVQEGGEDEALRPLGERVAALAVAEGQPPPPQPQEADALPQASDKASSLAVLLTQALRSNDRALLERCLSATSPHVVAHTVARLLPLDAATFLRAAVDRLLSTPARAAQLAPWIKATLHHHTGYLMSAPGAQAPLLALYQALDARVATYGQLLRLHGRLSLVNAHSRAVRAQQQQGGGGGGGGALAAAGRPEPETVFEDVDDDEFDGEEGEEEDDSEFGGSEEEEGGSDGEGGGGDDDDDSLLDGGLEDEDMDDDDDDDDE